MAIHKRGITDFQMKYYRRIYQARMVEQRRFDKPSSDEDKVFEDYQAIYEKTLEMQPEWGVERNDGGMAR